MVILRGKLSPGSAPDFKSSVLAVITFADMDVLVLFVSLFPGLGPVVGGE
jgi:hypothetical protein